MTAGIGRRSYAALAILSMTWALHAQGPSRQTFRSSSELVVIDLVAVDSRGRLVTDLRPEDIEVREEGRLQRLQLLRLVTSSDSPGSNVSKPGADVAARPPDRAARRLVVAIDAFSLSTDAGSRIREALLKALDGLPESMPVLFATVGANLVIHLPFTADRRTLTSAVSSLSIPVATPTSAATIFEVVDRVCAAADPQRVLDTAIETGERLIRDADARSAAASASLRDLLTQIGHVEGRKHLVFYSSGHAISPLTQAVDAVAAAASGCSGIDPMVARRQASATLGRLSSRNAADGFRAVIDRANSAQVTFYTLDPSGITTDAVHPQSRGGAQVGGAGLPMTFAQLRNDAGRDYLQGLADQTGGLFIKSNDLGSVLRRAWDDALQYYLVGYAPPSVDRGKPFRRLTVSVKRSGVDVRYRKGYLAMPTPAATAERSPVSPFLNPRAYENEDVVASASIESGRLAVEVLFPHTSIRFSEVDGEWRAAFTVDAQLTDASGRGVADAEILGKDIELRLTPDEYSRIRASRSLQTVLTAPAPRKGAYSLTVVVRDSGGWVATRQAPCCERSIVDDPAGGMRAADVLSRAARYVDEFVGRFSNVVIEETFEQVLTAPPTGPGVSRIPSPGATTRRRLVSEFLLVRPPGTVFWLPFRDVVEVDGRAITDRPDRLARLFIESGSSGTARAAQIAAAGAAFQLGPRSRTTTNPVIALAFLQPHHQHRFRYSVDKAPDTTSPHRVTLRFEEVTRPTLMRTDEGQDLPLRGAFGIDVRTGTVFQSELLLKTFAESVLLRTRYAFNDRLQVHIPSEMTESHLMKNGAKLETVARYGRFRTFSVSTSEEFKKE